VSTFVAVWKLSASYFGFIAGVTGVWLELEASRVQQISPKAVMIMIALCTISTNQSLFFFRMILDSADSSDVCESFNGAPPNTISNT
jgi:hypothetical protein